MLLRSSAVPSSHHFDVIPNLFLRGERTRGRSFDVFEAQNLTVQHYLHNIICSFYRTAFVPYYFNVIIDGRFR